MNNIVVFKENQLVILPNGKITARRRAGSKKTKQQLIDEILQILTKNGRVK